MGGILGATVPGLATAPVVELRSFRRGPAAHSPRAAEALFTPVKDGGRTEPNPGINLNFFYVGVSFLR